MVVEVLVCCVGIIAFQRTHAVTRSGGADVQTICVRFFRWLKIRYSDNSRLPGPSKHQPKTGKR